MLYQHSFQAEEIPARTHISCHKYTGENTSSYQLHCHAYYEISFVFKGKRHEIYDGNDYTVNSNSLFFISPLKMHGLRNISTTTDMVLQFSSDYLSFLAPHFEKDMILYVKNDIRPFMYVEEDSELMHILLELSSLCNSMESNPVIINPSSDDDSEMKLVSKRMSDVISNEIHIRGCLSKIISILLRDEFLCIKQGVASYSQLLLLDEVIDKILSHPDKVPDMKTAAHMAGFSYFNFSRIFKRVTGFGYAEYSTILRIRYAEELLVNSELSISDISEEIGVDNAGYFTRMFKKINQMSPSTYRKKYK